MDISVAYYSSRGKRDVNQDAVSLIEYEQNTLAVIADGLGGHESGDVASKQAISTISRLLQTYDFSEENLIHAIRQANEDINVLQKASQDMRTTVAVLWIHDETAMVANIGDTRIYQFRENKIIYQSLDHSVAQMAVLLGELKPEELRYNEDKNKLIRVLGVTNLPKVDTKVLTIRKGDRFLLCSDGFWGVVTEQEMQRSMAQSTTAKQWLKQMRCKIETLENNDQDNHTAIVLILE